MSGGLSIGRIYRRDLVSGVPQWTWLINGISAAPEVMNTAGKAADFEGADAALKENWGKWLAWAKLEENTDVVTTMPLSDSADLIVQEVPPDE